MDVSPVAQSNALIAASTSARRRAAWCAPHTVVAVLALLVASPGVATTPIPYPANVREKIEAVFLDASGRPDPDKMDAAREMLDAKKDWLARHVYSFERLVEDAKKKKARKKVDSRGSTIALEFALDLLERLRAAEDPGEIYRLAAMILTIDFATRIYQYPIGSVQLPIYLKNLVTDWDADASTREGDGPEEAANLVDPASGEFYTPEDLDRMIAKGVDISRLDPPGDGVLWRPWPDISRVDVIREYLQGGDALHDGHPAVFPGDDEDLELTKIRMTQTKPKIDVYWLDEVCREKSKKKRKQCRRKYKLKFGMEGHSDPVANSLMRAIGFNTDVSMHIKRPKVYLDDWTYDSFRRDWENYFDEQTMWTRLDLRKALMPEPDGRGEDEDGEYLRFVSAGIEYKPEHFVRVGGWSHGLIDEAAIGTGMREARALMAFNVWIGNNDTKDAENNKLILRKGPDGDWKMFMNLQDAGNAMGLILAEKVDAFPWDSVEQGFVQRAYGAMRGRIELNYFGVQNTGMNRTATHADLRWGVRLIAQLTREQIEDAVSLGRFPGGIGDLYVEKLISRRNQLVEAFGLSDEFESIPFDRKITTADGSVVDGKVKVSEFPEETPQDLGHHWRSLARPLGPTMWRFLRSTVAGAIGAIDSIGGTVELDGTDVELFPDLLINLSRDVRPNPTPTSELDQFIVQDSFTIGFRFAAGTFARGRVSARRIYKLAYAVPAEWQGRLHRNQALNWFLPIEARRGKLPEQYTLLRDTRLGPGIEIGSPDPSDEVTGGGDVAFDFLYDRRTVIDRRPGSSAVWIDHGPTASGEGRAWFKIFVLRFTLFRAQLEAGLRNGDTFLLERDVIDDDALDSAVASFLKNDTKPVRTVAEATQRKVSTRYLSFFRNVNLFFVKWRQRDRRDRVDFSDPDGTPTGYQVQSLRQRSFEWKILDNGEIFTCDIEGFLNPGGAEDDADPDWGAAAPVLVASQLIDDKNSHSDELDMYYGFLSELGGSKHLLPKEFEAQDWEQGGRPGGRWGRLLVEGQLVLRREALTALTHVDPDAYWDALAADVGMTSGEMRRLQRRLAPPRAKDRMLARRQLPTDIVASVRSSNRALHFLRAAREAGSPTSRLTQLTRALESATCFRGGRVKTRLPAILMQQIDLKGLAKRKQASARARIGTPVSDETKLPERRDFVGRLGKRHLLDQPDVIAEPFDPIELYNMLDWIRGEPKRAYVTPEVLR